MSLTAAPATPPVDKGPITPPEGYPEILSDLLTLLATKLAQSQVPQEQANTIAWECTEELRDVWGGQSVYINQGVTFETLRRYQEIWDKFTGDNIQELARSYDISEQAIYKAIRFMREEAKKRNQMALPLDG